jgi:hypothetical protein
VKVIVRWIQALLPAGGAKRYHLLVQRAKRHPLLVQPATLLSLPATLLSLPATLRL